MPLNLSFVSSKSSTVFNSVRASAGYCIITHCITSVNSCKVMLQSTAANITCTAERFVAF